MQKKLSAKKVGIKLDVQKSTSNINQMRDFPGIHESRGDQRSMESNYDD